MKSTDSIPNMKGEWYVVELIEKLEPVQRNEQQDLRRVKTWANFHLIKAGSPEEAYEKAVQLGKEGEFTFKNEEKVEMEYSFVGVGDLIPIYDENIEDGAEIMWTDYGNI